MNCTPWGALPWLARSTLTRPPFAVFGTWKAAALPFSRIFSESVVGLSLLSLPPQPAIATTVPIAARIETRKCIWTSTSYYPPLPPVPDPHPERAADSHTQRARVNPARSSDRLRSHRPDGDETGDQEE